jgi:putative MFS transporter
MLKAVDWDALKKQRNQLAEGIAAKPAFPGASDVRARLEGLPLTALHLVIVLLCACGFAVDLSELALGSALSAVFSTAPHKLPQMQLSWLLASVYAGAIGGAPLMGWTSDRIGPRMALAGIVTWLGLTSILAALSPTIGQLIVWRLLSGLALGAYPPLMIAYLADISPPRRRGLVIFSVCAVAYLAPPTVIFAIRSLTPLQPFGVEGWRWPLYGAGALCLFAGPGFLWLPEAPGWLLAKNLTAAASAICDRFARSSTIWPVKTSVKQTSGLPTTGGATVIPKRAELRPLSLTDSRLLLLSLIYFLIPWATVAFPLLTGPLLLARHFDLSETLFYVGVATVGPTVGTVLSGFIVDRFQRRLFMASSAMLMLVFAIIFFIARAPLLLAVSVIGFGVASALYLPAMTTYGAELFDAAVRGRATTTAWTMNRVAAAITPILMLPLLHSDKIATVALVIVGTLGISIVVLVCAPPHRPSVT